MTTGHGRVGQNRLLNGVEPHTTGCVRFDPVFSTLRISMNRLRFRFEPKREKNRTEPDFQTLGIARPTRTRTRDPGGLGISRGQAKPQGSRVRVPAGTGAGRPGNTPDPCIPESVTQPVHTRQTPVGNGTGFTRG